MGKRGLDLHQVDVVEDEAIEPWEYKGLLVIDHHDDGAVKSQKSVGFPIDVELRVYREEHLKLSRFVISVGKTNDR